MIDNAREIEPGSGGVIVVPSFMPSGPNKPYETQGTILGLGLTTDRSQVYRAALEGLSFQLKQAVKAFYETFSFEPTAVRVVGGGSKNHLWNQIRADVLGLPVITTSCEEGTVLGAALFAMVGSGIARSIEEAKKMVEISTRVWEPSENWPYYQKLYEEYEKLPLFLASHYRNKI
jgi:L-fuculokinase